MRPRHGAPALLASAVLLLAGCPKGGDTADGADGGLLGIGLSPNDPIMLVDESIEFEAKAFYDDYSSAVITTEVDWVSSDERVAVVEDDGPDKGYCTALAEGTADIIATYADGMSARVQLTVTGAEVTGISLSPSSVDVRVGDRVQLVATASFDDGSSGNVSGSCGWSSDSSAVASVDGAGLVTGESEGSTQVRASYSGFSIDPTSVTVVSEGTDLPDPDLRISSLDATVSGDTVSYSLVVDNDGGGYASEFYVDLFLDPGGEPGSSDMYDGFAWVPGLAAGESTPVYVDLYDVDAGAYGSWAWADADGFVEESNEDNNTEGPVSVTVSSGSSGYADLAISSFEGLSDGYYTVYSVVVTNNGGTASGDFYLDLFVDSLYEPEIYDDGDLWVDVPSLAPGESYTWEPDIEYGPYDYYYYYWYSWVLADSYDEVYESDESNNTELIEVWAE